MFRANLFFLPFMAVMMTVFEGKHQHFMAALGWASWPLAWAIQGRILHGLDASPESAGDTLRKLWHFLSVLLLTAWMGLEVQWQVNQQVSSAWGMAALSVVPGIIAMLIWRLRSSPAWPIPVHPGTYRYASLVLVAFQVLYLVVVSIEHPGNSDPLPYIPLLNPFGLAMLFAAFTAIVSIRILKPEAATEVFDFPMMKPYQLFLTAAFFLLTTCALVRGVHHFSGVPWDADRLYDSVIVQTSLSVYWGLLGFTGMIWGARKSSRLLWLFGAGFMALVVAKLFLIDLGNTGTVERIISFIAIGALLLVVGYFAPAPAAADKQH